MIAELGQFALVLAFCLCLPQAFFGLVGAHKGKVQWMQAARPAVAGQFVFTLLSFGCLAYAFYVNDFSVLYVASNSNSELPTFYRFAAVWGAHEGSLLLWLLVTATWSVALAAFSRQLPLAFSSRVFGVLGIVSAGFALFILTTSNPFERLIPAAADGRDLNPLLQDFGLAVHPPILYVGWLGFAIPFAFAVAALLEGRLDVAWARWVRPWTTLAWAFLTVGIALGSWWAYYELGWGGWWFWDPVENASFMPWLLGTALIHSLAVTEKRGLFRSWTVLLAISAFSLALLGGFLVRSGVLVSVHAFASDPNRGLFILGFLLLCIGGSLGLYAWRAPSFKSDAGFAIVSRESFLLLNNVMLVAAAGLILVGTLYPLFLEALDMGRISVGPPYFATVFVIPMLPLVFLLAIGMHASWKRARLENVKAPLLIALAVAAVVGIALPWAAYGTPGIMTVLGMVAGLWVIASSLIEPVSRLKGGHSLSPSVLGMSIAHLGLGLFVIGVTGVESYKIERDLGLKPGESVNVAGYDFRFDSARDVRGPNFDAVEAEVTILKDGETVTVLHPQKRVYRVQTNPMSEAGIDAGIGRDLFVALGEPLGEDAWSMRLQFKPLVRFIWGGCLVMAFGGLLATTDRRYRARATQAATVPASGAAASV
jgi:cytochrome c-type biogenesis protein CcmF